MCLTIFCAYNYSVYFPGSEFQLDPTCRFHLCKVSPSIANYLFAQTKFSLYYKTLNVMMLAEKQTKKMLPLLLFNPAFSIRQKKEKMRGLHMLS